MYIKKKKHNSCEASIKQEFLEIWAHFNEKTQSLIVFSV